MSSSRKWSWRWRSFICVFAVAATTAALPWSVNAQESPRDHVAAALLAMHKLPERDPPRDKALREASASFERAVFHGTTVSTKDKEYHRWLANLGFTHALRGNTRTAAGVLQLAVQLNPLDNWLWDRVVSVLGPNWTAHRCRWEAHMFFNPHVIHGKFYTRQLDVAEAVLYMSHLQHHDPRMLPNEETPSVNAIVAMLNFLRQKHVDGAVQTRDQKEDIEQVALQFNAELVQAGGEHLHTAWTRKQVDNLQARHAAFPEGSSTRALGLRARISNASICSGTPLFSEAMKSWSHAMLLLRAGFLREGYWVVTSAERQAAVEVVQGGDQSAGDLGETLSLMTKTRQWASSVMGAAGFSVSADAPVAVRAQDVATAHGMRHQALDPPLRAPPNFLNHRTPDLRSLMVEYREMVRSARDMWTTPETRHVTPTLVVGWVPDVGVGNQMLAVVSYLLLGLAMGRPVALYWMPGMVHDAQKVAQAFQIDDTLLPDFLTLAVGVPQLHRGGVAQRRRRSASAWSPAAVQNASAVLSFGERPRKIDDELAHTLMLGDLASTFAHTPVLHVVTNQPLWRFMERNPNYQQQLRKFCGVDVYGTLLPFVVRPSQQASKALIETMRSEPLLWNSAAPAVRGVSLDSGDLVVEAVQHHLSPAPLSNASARYPIVIGVHVRFGMDMVNDHYDARTQNAVLDDYIQGVRNSTLLTIRRYLAATALHDGPTGTPRSVIVFLAADNKEAKERARVQLLSLREVSRVVSVPSKSIDRGKDGMVGAGADLLALGAVAHAIVSSKRYFNAPHSYSLQSTFVGLASALMTSHGGVRPVARVLRPQCPVAGVTLPQSMPFLGDCEVILSDQYLASSINPETWLTMRVDAEKRCRGNDTSTASAQLQRQVSWGASPQHSCEVATSTAGTEGGSNLTHLPTCDTAAKTLQALQFAQIQPPSPEGQDLLSWFWGSTPSEPGGGATQVAVLPSGGVSLSRVLRLYPALYVLATFAQAQPASGDGDALAADAFTRFWGSAVVDVTEHLRKSGLSSYMAILPCGGVAASGTAGSLSLEHSLCEDAEDTGNVTALFLFGKRMQSGDFSSTMEG